MNTRVLWSSLAGVAALLVTGMALPTSANATTYPVTLNVSNCCGSGPFGTVNITQEATNIVEVTVALTQTGTQFVNTGLDASFAFNLAFSTVTISDVTSDGTTVFTANNTSMGTTTQGSGKTLVKMDGGGNFTYGMSLTGGQGGSNSGGQNLSFDVTATGITPQSFGTSSQGFLFAVDVIQNCGSGSPGATCAGPTGGVFDGTGTLATPLPGALAMFGPVLGIGYLGIRRRRRTSRSA